MTGVGAGSHDDGSFSGGGYAFQFHDFFMAVPASRFGCEQIFKDGATEYIPAAGQSVFLCLG